MWNVEQSRTANKSDVAWLVCNGRRYARGNSHDMQTLVDKLNAFDDIKEVISTHRLCLTPTPS